MTHSHTYTRPSVIRVLPPAATSILPQKLLRTYRQIANNAHPFSEVIQAHLGDILQDNLSCSKSYFTGSGTDALFRIFEVLKQKTEKRTVAISGYTCPSIAAAAIRAGMSILLVDTNKNEFSMSVSSFDKSQNNDVAAVIISNLFGIAEDLSPWEERSSQQGFIVVDDACQAALSRTNNVSVGARPNSIGVISFGRGKALGGNWRRCDCSIESARSRIAASNRRILRRKKRSSKKQ